MLDRHGNPAASSSRAGWSSSGSASPAPSAPQGCDPPVVPDQPQLPLVLSQWSGPSWVDLIPLRYVEEERIRFSAPKNPRSHVLTPCFAHAECAVSSLLHPLNSDGFCLPATQRLSQLATERARLLPPQFTDINGNRDQRNSGIEPWGSWGAAWGHTRVQSCLW